MKQQNIFGKIGQSEIIGLGIVVFLLTFGLLLYIIFGIQGGEESISAEFSRNQIPTILNNAILETHTTQEDCHGEKMQRLLIKTAEDTSFTCSNGQRVTAFTKTFIEDNLNKTLGDWNMEYRYLVYTGSNFKDNTTHIFMVTNTRDSCWGKDITTENFFFRTSNGEFLNVKLDICT